LYAVGVTAALVLLAVHFKRVRSELQRLAMYDTLTDIFNRRAFMELAGRESARSQRSHEPFAVLMMDLDHFKRVNDRHGHQAGDRVLRAFAAVLKRGVRTADLVCRYGGEEFCALLPDTGRAEATAIAERIRAAAAEKPLAGLPLPVTVSIGVGLCKGDGCTLEEMITRADEALYRAKRTGRNRVVTLASQPNRPAASDPAQRASA
jgi:diguanylate cyclase (GGDEF)-like protein